MQSDTHASAAASSSSPTLTCFLLRMPPIHAQLLMHHMSGLDLLSFARTCRNLRALAADPFSSRHASIRLRYFHPMQSPTPTGAITKQMQTTLIWHSKNRRVVQSEFESLVPFVANLRVRELDTSAARRIKQTLWVQLLGHRAFQQLQTLVMHSASAPGMVDAPMLAALAALPHLHTLSVVPLVGATDAWKALASAPSLSTLYLQDTPGLNSHVQYIAAYSRLTRLGLRWPSPSVEDWRALSAGLPSLTSLTLSGFSLDEVLRPDLRIPTAEEFRGIFAVMRRLVTLELIEGDYTLLSLLAPLVAAPALRSLRFWPGPIVSWSDDPPNADVEWIRNGTADLTGLLTVNLLLHCTVILDEAQSATLVQRLWAAIVAQTTLLIPAGRLSLKHTSAMPAGLFSL